MDMEEITQDGAEGALMDVDNSNEDSSEKYEVKARAEVKAYFKTSLSSLREQTELSSTFYVRNLSWQIKLERRLTRRPRTLGFYLRCNGVPQSSTWSCFAVAELSLLKHWSKPSIYSKSADDAFSRNVRHMYHRDENEAGFTGFISWEDLCDPRRGFIIDDSIEVEVHLRADVPRIEYVEPNAKIKEQQAHSEITYHFELPKVSTFRGQHISPNFSIHNMPFKVMLRTIPEENPTALSFYLICLGDPEHISWSCYVEAELKLMNQDNIGEAYTRTFKHLFCKTEAHFGFRRFIPWKDVLKNRKGFVKNDTARFEIEVRTDASAESEVKIDRLKLNVFQKQAKLRCIVYNISQLKGTLFASPFYVRNLPWRVKLMHRICVGPTRQIQRYLSVYLQCSEEYAEVWSCNATAVLTILSHDGEECGRGLRHVFSKQKNYSGFSHFIPWHYLLDPEAGFIKNDIITLLVYLKAEEPTGIN